jgi:phosphoribosyl-ATP pyrophosphohydrolase/phosphoribosyl-AMP cyclohydrolase
MTLTFSQRMWIGTRQRLVPVVIQDAETLLVLVLGYMDRRRWSDGKYLVTFYSHSDSGCGGRAYYALSITWASAGLRQDTLLIYARPEATCHLGTSSCFGEDAPKR